MLICKILTEVQFSVRTKALRNKAKKILPFVTTYNPATLNLTIILMKHWHIIQQQPKLAHIFKQQQIVSYRKQKSLKDISVHTKLPLITPQSNKTKKQFQKIFFQTRRKFAYNLLLAMCSASVHAFLAQLDWAHKTSPRPLTNPSFAFTSNLSVDHP